jgi:hypothetical protein
MPSLFVWAITALLSYAAYTQLHALFETVVRRAPPVAANSWWALLTRKSVPGGKLVQGFYEKVSLSLYLC